MESLNHHKYKRNSSHSEWTRYTPIISSKINLSQMKTSVTRNSRHYLLAKTTWSKLHPIFLYIGGCSLFLCLWNLYLHSFEWLVLPSYIDETTMRLKGRHMDKQWWWTKQKVTNYRHTLFFRKDTHIKYLCAIILRQIVLDKSMLPLHARVMDFFDTVEEKDHKCAMCNIYNSDEVFKAAYNHEKNYWLMVLQGNEWEASRHILHKINWS